MSEHEKDLDYFIEKFNILADGAHSYGLSVVILMENADPIAKQSSVTSINRCTYVTEVGLLKVALRKLLGG